MIIDIVKNEEFEQLHNMIARTCLIAFKNYYPQKEIERESFNH